jgi:colanic acid/amylovoran biosynthesis protein
VTSGRPLKIGLLWHSAKSGNLGVGALTLSNMAIVRQVAADMGFEPEFVILGMRDAGESYVPADAARIVEIDARFMLSPAGFWRAVGDLDCVLDIGGGDSFADIYSSRRFAYIWLSKILTSLHGRPLLFSPQTIGPFTREPHTLMAKLALRGAEAIIARDPPSFEAVQALAPRVRTVLSTDVAFSLPFTDRSAERGGTRLRVGVNASGLLFGEGSSQRPSFGLGVDYAALTRRFIEGVLARGDADIHLITHVTTTDRDDDDGWAADQLLREYPQAIRVPDFAGPSEAKSYISSLDFLVAGRMHACIGAISSLTPVVPIAYSRKFRGVLGSLGYAWMIDTDGWDTDRAVAFLADCLDRRLELAQGATEAMRRVDPLLDIYRAELRRFFQRFAPG